MLPPPGDTTQGMVDDGGSEGSSSGSSGEGSSSSGEPMGSTTSGSSSGGEESESTTGAPFVCKPIDLGMATGEVATGTTVGENDDILAPCMKFDSVDIEYQWTAPTAGTWQIDTYGSAYDTALLVLAGDCDGAQLACNDDIGTTESAVIVDLEAGETILVVVDGFGGAEGDFVLHIGEAVPGDCCTPGPFGGCDDPACESAVCASDPSCCNEAWDATCALELAPSLCDECAPPGSCCFAHEDPGCDDVSCEVDVCAKDPTCCSVAWTQACSDLATQLCLECAPGTGNCCASHVEP